MLKNLFRSQLRINMASGVVTTVVNVVVLAIAYLVYLHFLGYEKYGVWLVLATVLSFAQLGNLGISQAIMKLVAEEHGRGNIEAIQQYVATAIVILTMTGAAILLVILAFKTQIASAFKLTGENARMVLWLLPYIGCLSIYAFIVQTLNATLSGLGRMDLANYTQALGRIVNVVTAGCLLYRSHGIESLLIGNTLSYVFIHIASLILILRIVHIRFFRIGNLDKKRFIRLLRFGGGIFGGLLITMFVSPFNKLMLSRYAGVSSIPIYEIAYNGSRQVRTLIEVGFRAFMPEVSRLSRDKAKKATDRISQIYRRAMKLIFLFGFPIYGILAIFAPLLLRLWLGDKYVEILPDIFRIMLAGTFLTLLGVPAYYITIGFGRVRDIVKTNIMSAGGNFILVMGYYVLTGHLSVYSVAWCFVLSTVIPLAYFLYITRHLLASDTE